jgi:hypothetical protein
MIKHEIRNKDDDGTSEVSLTPMKAIRNHCLECTGWSAHEVKICTDKLCNCYPYRLGTNPERAGIGGKG